MSKSIRRFMWCAVLLVASISLAGIASASTPDDQSATKDKLDGIAQAIQDKLSSMGADLSIAAASLSDTPLDGAKARQILADLCKKHRSAIDCSTIDAKGTMVAVEPAPFRKFEGSDISNQEQIKKLHSTKKPVLSEPFRAVEGFYSLDFEWPILAKDGALRGSVSMIVKPLSFIDGIVKPELSGNVSDVWVMQTDGRILYSRFHEDIGDNPYVTPTYGNDTTYNSLVVQIVGQPSGAGHYDSRPVGNFNPMMRRCVWKTIS
ncbi:MAG: hypothetical protein WC690_09790, partial [bacterium]